jgi:hypothetical protein
VGKGGKGKRRSAQGEAELHHVSPGPPAVLLVRRGAAGVTAAETGIHSAGRARGGVGAAMTPRGKINGEDGELASGIRVRGRRRLPPNTEVAVFVGTTEARGSFDQ